MWGAPDAQVAAGLDEGYKIFVQNVFADRRTGNNVAEPQEPFVVLISVMHFPAPFWIERGNLTSRTCWRATGRRPTATRPTTPTPSSPTGRRPGARASNLRPALLAPRCSCRAPAARAPGRAAAVWERRANELMRPPCSRAAGSQPVRAG